MSSFLPSSWDVRPIADMDAIVATPREGSTFSMKAMMAAPPAAGLEGTYSFAMCGTDHMRIRVETNQIIPDKRFEDMIIEAQLQLGDQIVIEKNSSCSKWYDIYALAQSQDLEVLGNDSSNKMDLFISTVAEYIKSKPE